MMQLIVEKGSAMSYKKDPALDDVPADDQMFGSIDGPGRVSKNTADNKSSSAPMQLRPAPEKTKSISKKGMMIVFGLFSIVILMLFVGIATTGHVENQQAAASAEPRVEQSAHGQALNVASVSANSSSISTSINASDPGAISGASKTASSPAPGQGQGGPTDPNRPPTPREQYLEWLEKHQYDRLRARWMADQQAYGAKVIDDSAGGGLMAAAGGLPRMPSVPGALPMPPAVADGEDDRVLDARRRAQDSARMLAQAAAAAIPGIPTLPSQSSALSAVAPASRTSATSAAAALTDRDERARESQKAFFAESGKEVKGVGYLEASVTDKRPGYEVSAGSIIPAVMLSSINSDLPGSIVAQVRSDVYSTFDYTKLVIPAGSRIVGRYSSDIAYGQERILVAWDELIFPNGKRIAMGGMSGVDATGAAGLSDQVHTHFWRTWGNALLVSMLGVGVQKSQPQNAGQNNTPTTSQLSAAAAMNSLNDTASQILKRNLNVAPTLEIRPGYVFNVMVNKSISLPAYEGN